MRSGDKTKSGEERERQTDRQTDRQSDRQRQRERETDRQTERVFNCPKIELLGKKSLHSCNADSTLMITLLSHSGGGVRQRDRDRNGKDGERRGGLEAARGRWWGGGEAATDVQRNTISTEAAPVADQLFLSPHHSGISLRGQLLASRN